MSRTYDPAFIEWWNKQTLSAKVALAVSTLDHCADAWEAAVCEAEERGRGEGLEEAAKVAESYPSSAYPAGSVGRREIASAIRRLAAPTPSAETE